jgi:hypothetical protein
MNKNPSKSCGLKTTVKETVVLGMRQEPVDLVVSLLPQRQVEAYLEPHRPRRLVRPLLLLVASVRRSERQLQRRLVPPRLVASEHLLQLHLGHLLRLAEGCLGPLLLLHRGACLERRLLLLVAYSAPPRRQLQVVFLERLHRLLRSVLQHQ